MGIIRKQTIKSTIYTYIGVLLGFVTSAVIFPRVLETDEIGLLNILVSYSVIFAQLASMGFNTVTIKLFPFFKDKSTGHHGFLPLALFISIAGFLITMVVFFIIKPYLVNTINEDSPLFGEYIYYLIPLVFFVLYYNLFDIYYRALLNSVIGVFTKEFLQRIFIFGAIILYYFDILSFSDFILLYVISIAVPSLVLAVSLIIDKEFFIKPYKGFISKDLRKHMISVSFFGIISGFSGIVIFTLDKIMIERIMGLSYTGIYATCFYFATLIVMPARAMLKIAGPLTAEAWKDKDKNKLLDIYRKTALNLWIIGLLFFILIWANVDNIFIILSDKFIEGYFVIFFIGLAYLSDMISGANMVILGNSRLYKYQTYLQVVLIVLVVITNLLLIPEYGITGAAIASLISKLIVNFLRFLLLKQKFNLQPYNLKFIYVLIIGGIAYYSVDFISQISVFWIDLIVRSIIIIIVFGVFILSFRISGDINNTVYLSIQKTKQIFRQ